MVTSDHDNLNFRLVKRRSPPPRVSRREAHRSALPPPNRSRPTQFQVWDLGGQTSIRPYWRCYYPNTDAIIFVVDSADVERMPVARGELAAMLEEDELRDAILLVFANKQDQKGALHAQQISDALGLPEVRNRQWSIQETSALQGKGLFEGFDWLVSCIKGAEGE